jgi:hypothetical protein
MPSILEVMFRSFAIEFIEEFPTCTQKQQMVLRRLQYGELCAEID